MYNIREIQAEECEKLSSEMDLDLIQLPGIGKMELFLKEGNDWIDSTYSFTDKRYLEFVKKFHGKLLVIGLGFGCNAIRACQNKDVTSVTVIESRKEVIDLFYKIHGKKFEDFEKLTIINGDMMKHKERNYDCVFIDFIHPPQTEQNTKDLLILKKRFKKSELFHLKLS